VGSQPPFLPDVEARKGGRERQAGERGEHEPDVDDEEEVRVVARAPDSGPTAGACGGEQRHGERHDDQTEQPVRPAAAPDEVRRDDEPDE
jgi:hypothetical protein